MIIEVNNKTKNKIDLKPIKTTTEKFLNLYSKRSGQELEISIAIVGDQTIRKLNKTYRKIDKITDVLAFPDKEVPLGEVIINYTQVKKQAKKFNNSTGEELIFILAHGLLHLLGYNDSTEQGRKEMEMIGENFLKSNF